ncbi:MAG: hypothetical protein ACLQPH_19555 [Acidimicrobiales bacterium]
MLTGFVIVTRMGEAVHLSNVRDVLFRCISSEMRAELGVPDPPSARDTKGWKRTYRNVRTRFHGLLDLMDHSDRPKDRRLDDDVFAALLEQRSALRSDADRQEAYDRLHWFVNQLLEASFLMLPRRYRRRWNGSVSVDATVIPAFARAERRGPGKQWQDRPVLRHSSDPDCGYYVRGPDDRDDEGGPKHLSKAIWGYEASLVACGHVEAMGEAPLPVLVVAMPPLHVPGREPGKNAVRGLNSLADRGHPVGRLAADNNYSAAKPVDFQLPARALGYDLVLTYRDDQLGVQAQSQGFLLVEGRWYCPAMPKSLIDATSGLRARRIDDETYEKRIEARLAHEARPNGNPDPEGHQRLLCPAAQGSPTARCVLKPKTDVVDPKVQRVRIRPTGELRNQPPACCRQETVTVPPVAGAKFYQFIPLGTPEHRKVYATLRNAVEGMNGFLKDSAFEGMGDPQRRRVRGVAAQSVLVAFQILAGNLRKIDTFLEKMSKTETDGAEERRTRRRRRTTDPVQKWLDGTGSAATGGRAPPWRVALRRPQKDPCWSRRARKPQTGSLPVTLDKPAAD